MFCAVSGAPVAETSSDEKPISLPDNIEEPAFDIFLDLVFGQRFPMIPRASAATPVLISLLELSHFFLSQPTRELALSVIRTNSYCFNPALLIHLSFKYQTRILFSAAFHRLASQKLRDLTPEARDQIGFLVFSKLANLKEALQEHRNIVSAEEPPIKVHADDCQDNSACERDWHAAWWNGIGRFLLDGRHPLTWTDGMERFEKFEFSEMAQGCQTKMLDFVRGGDGYAHSYSMTDAVAKELMDTIEEESHSIKQAS
ncbi:hypothetical protein C8J57DRAFT_1259775 [Mycena rebaudengoi]|nr:hypothetical protein C8J57DRAFT_1259775 [Mycena rebaudengoi]